MTQHEVKDRFDLHGVPRRLSLGERFIELSERCPSCWAREFSDMHPRTLNMEIASERMKDLGNPDCTLRHEVKAGCES